MAGPTTAADDGQQEQQDKLTLPNDGSWVALFDGESLGRWEPTEFGGQGDVRVEKGRIVLPFGSNLTGITWDGEPPARMSYEVALEAQRVDGNDFFCGLTVPVRDDHCSLIVGGWGGGLVGISSLDDRDASQNDTSSWHQFEDGRWYRIRLRVTPGRIRAWIDGRNVVDADVTDRKISVRPEVELSRPLGVASFQTTAALRNIRMRRVTVDSDE